MVHSVEHAQIHVAIYDCMCMECNKLSFLTRYSYAVGVYGTMCRLSVDCRPSAVTDVLWLNGRSYRENFYQSESSVSFT